MTRRPGFHRGIHGLTSQSLDNVFDSCCERLAAPSIDDLMMDGDIEMGDVEMIDLSS